MGTPNLTLPISIASSREIDIVPTWRYANSYEPALAIVAAAKEDKTMPQLLSMITHRFSGVENVPAALQTAGLAKDEAGRMVVKVVVENTV